MRPEITSIINIFFHFLLSGRPTRCQVMNKQLKKRDPDEPNPSPLPPPSSRQAYMRIQQPMEGFCESASGSLPIKVHHFHPHRLKQHLSHLPCFLIDGFGGKHASESSFK